ncbi:MAG: restriction endonuclease subunit S [Candidatus Bathyarchaeia archaeon]|jgi:type I restriction enzyme S subunit
MNFYKETDFQESIIGKYPKDWTIARIDEKFDTSSGGTPDRQRKEYYKGTIPWVKSGELKDKVIIGTEEKITEEGFKNSAAKLFPKGTLLVAMYGATVGKTGILGIDATTNQAVCALLPKEKDVDINYFQHSLVSIRNRWIFQSAGGAQPNISQDIIRSSRIPFPPFKEQQQIARVLGVVDCAIELADRVIAQTERLKRGLMQQLLTRGIGHTETKQTPIGQIPENWAIVALGDVSDDFIGGGTPSTTNPEYWNGDIAWMTSAHINGKQITRGQKYITKEGLENSATHLIPKDNLLVATRVGIGKVAVNTIDIAISQDLTGVIINRKKALPEFLYWVLINNGNRLKALAQGSTIKGLLKEDLSKFQIPLPTLEEQQRIDEILSTADKKLELERGEKVRLERIKRGLMDLLLTGKVRIKVD